MSPSRQERDKLIEGSGTVAVELSGADFEFLEKAALVSSARDAKPVEIGFTLPLGKRAGPQNSVAAEYRHCKARLLSFVADASPTESRTKSR